MNVHLRQGVLSFLILSSSIFVSAFPYLLMKIMGKEKHWNDLYFVMIPFLIGAGTLIYLLVQYLFNDLKVEINLKERPFVSNNEAKFYFDEIPHIEVFYALDFSRALYSSFKYYRLIDAENNSVVITFLSISEKKVLDLLKNLQSRPKFIGKSFPSLVN